MNTPFTVSNHSLGIIMSCQRAGHYYKILGRVKAEEVKPGADAGTAIHAALARYYAEQVSMNTACVALADHVAGEDYRTPVYLADCLRAYEKEWGDDRVVNKTVAVELPFSLNLSDWLTFEGRIDRVYETSDGRLICQDHKTSKQYGNSDLDRFARNPAMPGYVWAASQLLARPVCTTELNSITMRPPLVKERADSKARYEFHRAQFLVTSEQVEEWRLNTLRVVTGFLRAVAENRVEFNSNSCVTGFGRCPYFDCCEQPPAQRLTLLYTDMYRDYEARVNTGAGGVIERAPQNLVQSSL